MAKAPYRTQSDTLKLQRLIDVLKERGSDLANSLEDKAKDFLSDVKQKRHSPLIPHYDSDASSGGSSFGKNAGKNDSSDDDDWGSDWEEWNEEDNAPKESKTISDKEETKISGEKDSKPDVIISSPTPPTPSTGSGSCCFIAAYTKGAERPSKDVKSSVTATAASAAAITTVAAMAAASPAAAEIIGGSAKKGTENSIYDQKDSPRGISKAVEADIFESNVKPLMSLMEFDSSLSSTVKFPTLAVNIPEAFDTTTSSVAPSQTQSKSPSIPLSQKKNASPRKPNKMTTFTTHKEAVTKKQESLVLSKSQVEAHSMEVKKGSEKEVNSKANCEGIKSTINKEAVTKKQESLVLSKSQVEAHSMEGKKGSEKEVNFKANCEGIKSTINKEAVTKKQESLVLSKSQIEVHSKDVKKGSEKDVDSKANCKGIKSTINKEAVTKKQESLVLSKSQIEVHSNDVQKVSEKEVHSNASCESIKSDVCTRIFNKTLPKCIPEMPPIKTAMTSVVNQSFQDPALSIIRTEMPDMEPIVSHKYIDTKELFTHVVKVVVVSVHFQEEDVQQRKKTMSVTFQDPVHETLASPDGVSSPEIVEPPLKPLTSNVSQEQTTNISTSESLQDNEEPLDSEVADFMSSQYESDKVPEKRRDIALDKSIDKCNILTLSKSPVKSPITAPASLRSSIRTPIKGLSRSLSKTAIPTVTQQEFQASIYQAPEGANIPKVAGARSKKPTLAAQLRKQKEKQKLRIKQKVDRLNSFDDNWPGNIPNESKRPATELLADAGFHFVGMNDCVKCLHCDLVLNGWEEFDDPWIRHCQNSPGCNYVLESKGPEWVYDNYKAEE